MEIADRISRELSVRPIIIDAHAKVTYGRREVLTNINSAPAYVIANAAFGYRAHQWGVDVNVHNLTNRRYFVAANMAGAYLGEPLSAYITLHADF
ncbi:hypothetical protein [Paraburkholderia terrae]